MLTGQRHLKCLAFNVKTDCVLLEMSQADGNTQHSVGSNQHKRVGQRGTGGCLHCSMPQERSPFLGILVHIKHNNLQLGKL